MPITPFHFGPGILIKSASPKEKFNLAIFIFTQFIIDLETLNNILQNKEKLHTFFHTYVGSTIAAIIAICFFIIFYNIRNKLKILSAIKIPNLIVLTYSSLIGAWSHILLDSIMHSDQNPLWPFSSQNQMLNIISIDNLHIFCAISGLFGLIIWGLREHSEPEK